MNFLLIVFYRAFLKISWFSENCTRLLNKTGVISSSFIMQSDISDSNLPFLSDIIYILIWDSLKVFLRLTGILNWCTDILVTMKCHGFPLCKFVPGVFSSGLKLSVEGLLGEQLCIGRETSGDHFCFLLSYSCTPTYSQRTSSGELVF